MVMRLWRRFGDDRWRAGGNWSQCAGALTGILNPDTYATCRPTHDPRHCPSGDRDLLSGHRPSPSPVRIEQHMAALGINPSSDHCSDHCVHHRVLTLKRLWGLSAPAGRVMGNP